MNIFRTHIVKMNNLLNMGFHQHYQDEENQAHKLEEKTLEEEHTRLNQLRKELTEEFGKDLWEKSLEKQRGKGTTEDLYWWYKKQVKMGQTPSEMVISLGRKTTKGLQPNKKIYGR